MILKRSPFVAVPFRTVSPGLTPSKNAKPSEHEGYQPAHYVQSMCWLSCGRYNHHGVPAHLLQDVHRKVPADM